MSALSAVAIKDGATGHGGRGGHQSANTLAAERADRISRLAGLERVANVRTNQSGQPFAQGGYYEQMPNLKEMSTVGSASATGSVGGKTTWMSEMDYDADKMSEDHEDSVSSTGGVDDEGRSLVDFGEGAGSTVDGPVSTPIPRTLNTRNSLQSPTASRTSQPQYGSSTSMPSSMSTTIGIPHETLTSAYIDQGDTSHGPSDQTPTAGRFSGAGIEIAENVLRGRILSEEEHERQPLGTPPDGQSLGKFTFEKS